MYEYSENLEWYRELRNLSHAASFKEAHCKESFEPLKRVLVVEAGTPSSGNNGGMRYGPVLAQNQEFVYVNRGNVLDPEHVKGRGAPKKGFTQWIRKYQRNNVVVVIFWVTIGVLASREKR
jgi:zinc finger SWIM domain-containing protein 3